MQDDLFVPPHNERAEQMLLASLLIDPSYSGECSEIRPEDFYNTAHRKIYESINYHIRSGLPVDAGLIAKSVPNSALVINALLDDPGPAGSVPATAKIIKGESVKRRLVEQANAIIKRAVAGDPAEDTLDYAYRQIASLCSLSDDRKGVSLKNVYDAGRMVDEYKAYLANLKDNRFITGIHEIDRRIRGVAGGEVMTILARAGSFKTALLQNLLTNYLRNSKWGAVMFSIEMPVASITERWFQIMDGCAGKEVQEQFTNPEKQSFTDISVKQFKQDLSRLYVVPSKVAIEDIPQYVKLIQNEFGVKVGLIGVDYLGLMDAPGEIEYQQISYLARGVKMAAKQINLPVIMLSQVSRKGGDGEVEISLDHGRGSGAIEEGADFVLGLWQQARPECGQTEAGYDLICRILKNRKGPKGSRWILELDAPTMRFGSGAFEWTPPKPTRRKKACD